MLGGKTATLSEGRVTQFGRTIDVYNNPSDLLTAQTFSDPPMNVLEAVKEGNEFRFADSRIEVPGLLPGLADGRYMLGVRPHHMKLEKPVGKALKLDCTVSTTEITGSESFIHLKSGDTHMVALVHGVHRVGIGDSIPAYLEQKSLFIFDSDGKLVLAPASDSGN